MFRNWLVLSSLWLLGCGRIDYAPVQTIDDAGATEWSLAFGDVLGLPISPKSLRLVQDHSRGHHHGNTRATKTIVDGVYGSALAGTYVGSRLDIPDHFELFVGNEFTLETWILLGPSSVPFNLYNDGKELQVRLESTTRLVVRSTDCDGDEATVSFDFSPALEVGQWTHFAVAWNGIEVRAFTNAEEVGSNPFEMQPCEATGRLHSIELPLDGAIDEFKLWRRPRSVRQLLDSMNFDSAKQASYCGDGVVEGEEQCETFGACCEGATCRFSAAGTACGAGLCEEGVCTTDQGVATAGLLAQYGFDDGSGTVVSDRVSPELDLEILDPANVEWGTGHLKVRGEALIQSAVAAAKISTAVKASGQATVEAWVIPALVEQEGPARIVNMGIDITQTNFLLGQERGEHACRFRSTGTRTVGSPDLAVSQVETELTHLVATLGPDSYRRLYVNGVLRATHATSGTLVPWDDTWPLSVANESGRERPWLGELHLIRIYNRALSHVQIGRNFRAGPE